MTPSSPPNRNEWRIQRFFGVANLLYSQDHTVRLIFISFRCGHIRIWNNSFKSSISFFRVFFFCDGLNWLQNNTAIWVDNGYCIYLFCSSTVWLKCGHQNQQCDQRWWYVNPNRTHFSAIYSLDGCADLTSDKKYVTNESDPLISLAHFLSLVHSYSILFIRNFYTKPKFVYIFFFQLNLTKHFRFYTYFSESRFSLCIDFVVVTLP